jgi:DNA polymerase-3 subunit epsilon
MRFIAFDLETTGFIPGVDKIVEVGAVRFIDGQVESVFSTLVDPKMDIPEAASRVNGISNTMVAGKPTIDLLMEPFAEFCGDDILVAHNANFDFQFLVSDIVRLETKAPRGAVLDSCNIARKVMPGLPNYKLGTLVQHLGIPSSNFHRAEEDASYCGHLFIKLMQKMTGGLTLPPLENLVMLSGKTELKFPQITPKPKQLGLFDMV